MNIKITGLDELQRKLDKMAKAASPQETASRWRSARCPDHGQAASNIRVSGDKITADFCCDAARQRAVERISDGIQRAIR